MYISDTGYNLNNEKLIPVNTKEASKGNAGLPDTGDMGNIRIRDAAPGQLFAGQIIDISQENVSILLENNMKMYARLGENVKLNIGEQIVFQVKDNTGDSVLIKPLNNSKNSDADNAVFKILESNNLSLSDKNYQVAKALMENGMPVDKGTLVRVLNQSFKFPDASVDNIVAMNKYNIPVTKENINQFQDYMENNHQLSGNITRLGDELLNYAESVMSDIENIFVDRSQANDKILDLNRRLLEVISDKSELADIQSDLEADINTNPKASIEALSKKLDIPAEDIRAIYKFLEKAGIGEEKLNMIADKSESSLKLLNNINALLSDNTEPDIDVRQFLSLDSYKKIFGKGIRDKFTVAPDKMEAPDEINHIYKSLYEKAGNIIENFGNRDGFGESLKNASKGLQERLEFIQNLNNLFGYSQIPVKMSSSEVNSELLVYLNQKRLKEGRKDISALLHLDMEHLGPTDVHVSLRGGMVHTKFYVDDEESAAILTKYMDMLEQAVNDKGYTLSNEVVTRTVELKTDANMVVMSMMGNDLEKSIKRYSFDVKM